MQLVVVSAVIAVVSMATSTFMAFFLMICHTFSRIPSKFPMIFLFFSAILVVATPLQLPSSKEEGLGVVVK